MKMVKTIFYSSYIVFYPMVKTVGCRIDDEHYNPWFQPWDLKEQIKNLTDLSVYKL